MITDRGTVEGCVHVIGIGRAGWSSLAIAEQNCLQQATVVVGSDRQLHSLHHLAGDLVPITHLQATLTEAKARWEQGDRLVILASGDPLCFGLGRLLLAYFPAAALVFHPHVSSIQLAFSRLKLPWQDAAIASVHGREPEELIRLLRRGVEKIAVLTDGVHHPGAIATLYQALDLPQIYRFWVCENLGGADERVFELDEAIAPSLTADQFAPLNVVVLVRQEEARSLPPLPIIGIPDQHFLTFRDRPGLMTKGEIRLAILGALALMPAQVVWDIGAGTGSVSVEIGRLCPTSQVFAIEKTAMGVNLIEQNAQRFQVQNLNAVSGAAPEALNHLPRPDRVFIGGSGGNLAAILSHCQDVLAPGGRLVLAMATLESIHTALEWLRSHDWPYDLAQWNVARSLPIAQSHRLAPLNPVTIITATPPLS
ncbi:precorrin-6y C5,15-methyltransferase (decarboxylating) subunit CbiE [Spirulina major CS-329]|uniref:precorrin-6y C5,15-methyltransferase (decarboxylating) subunit CbiE n=1 Tax=Spirulina TaxID=1154 RepID=UPI00232B98F4|nr:MULTISPECIES: precorrin-6y C5,15-methyltransferase (decarboxylating) subunit CbiE [Spirulina]MDB9495099.1 precorrin-6y C5,15-methyltransferase (decarboxylating) subunit CbiE [Spirulina subsalsa CS-330]MDB9501695.1 precorrin-6y C5,15-methyltransferase (decarboxylating) subunit CbiE [Spirulina major CS-329]